MSLRRGLGVDSAIVNPAADPSSHLGGRLLASGVLATAVLSSIVLYPAAFGADVHPVGPDMFAYIWQTRLVGTGSLAEVGTRPGVPVLGSVMSGFHAVPGADAPLVLGLVLAIALGSAVAFALRLAFRLPYWSLGVVTFTIVLWGGAVSLSRGYLANELSLVCVVLGILLVALPGAHVRARVIGGFAAVTAAGIAHPGFLPFSAAVDVVWLVLSLPRIIRGRHAGQRWWEVASVRSLVTLAGATMVTALVIFGFMGLRAADVTNLTAGTREFSEQLSPMLRTIGLFGAVSILAAAGVIAAWRLRGPLSQDLTRAGSAWALCSAAGGLATLANPALPGPRALLVILPFPAAAGLGIVWIVRIVAGAGQRPVGSAVEPRRLVAVSRVIAAAGVVVVSCALVAAPGLSTLRRVGKEPVRGAPARLVASYVATVAPNMPVVVFMSPSTERFARTWRGKQNQVRAHVPTSEIASTFVVVGVLGGADGKTPEPMAGTRRTENRGFAFASEQSWVGGGPALRNGALIVVPRVFNKRLVWKSIWDDPARLVAPGLAVLRGPKTAPRVSVAPAAVPNGEFMTRALACLLVLAALGGGYAAASARALDATRLDAVAVAPAMGVVLAVLTGLVVSLPNGDPGGPVGLAAATGIAVVGYLLAWRVGARTDVGSG